MKKNLIFIFLLLQLNLYTQTETEDEKDSEDENRSEEVITSVKEDRIRTLRYGIDDEVSEIISAVRSEKDNSYNEVLGEILQETGNSKIIISIIEFFEEQESDLASEFTLKILKEASEDYDVDERVLGASIAYSGSRKLLGAVEYLFSLSDNKDNNISASAIRNLGKTGDITYAEQFLFRLQDDDFEDDQDEIRESVILLLGELKYEPAVLMLMDIVQDDSYSAVARRYACDSLGKIGDEVAIPVLKDLLNDPDSFLRSYAISSLAQFNTDEIEKILMQALRDSFWRIRVAASESLAERKSTNAVDILIYKAEKDPEANVKKAAMDALAIIGGEKAWTFLSDYFKDEKNSDVFRSTAINVLLREKPEESVDSLKSVFEEEWEEENSWLLNTTCKELSTTVSDDLSWFYEKMLTHKNYIIKIYAVRGIRLNELTDLYARVKEIVDNSDAHRALRKEAATIE